jgi:hypothetical protein
MSEYEKYSLIISAAGVLTAIAVVVVAIWGEWFRQLLTKPKLILKFENPSFNVTTNGIKGWYYILRVKNKRSSSPAKNVRILLTNIYKKGPGGSWREVTFSGPVHVTWRWPQITPFHTTVGPDEFSTFGHLLENSKGFVLTLIGPPNNLQPLIPPNDPTRLVYKAVSDTAESNPISIEMVWNGQWDADSAKMENNLTIHESII